MAGYSIFNEVDIDGRHWKFAEQQRDQSCGPTAVKIAKELIHNQTIGEDAIRGAVGLVAAGNANTGTALLQADIDHGWDMNGSMEHEVLPALKRSPSVVPEARFAQGIDPLKGASRNHPAILGFNWHGGGGHFVVCVGLTKKKDKFVILDPGSGIEYLTATDPLVYQPSYGSKGDIDPVGYIVT